MSSADINPAIIGMLKNAQEGLLHEQSVFHAIDLKPTHMERAKATFSAYLPDDFRDSHGHIHGGLLSIILDSIFGLAVFTALDALKPIATINLRTDYMAKAAPGGRVSCAAECLSINGDVAHVTGGLTDEASGTLIATGTGAFMIGTRGPKTGSRL